MAIRIQIRKDAASVWDSADSVLKAGEFGFAWDSADSASYGRLKVGDGTSTWTALPYFYYAGDSAGNYASAGGAAGIDWGGARGLFLGGRTASTTLQNIIDYVDITTPGNATDFGDLTANKQGNCAFGDTTYVCEAGGVSASSTTATNIISRTTVATTGNASDFGDLLSATRLMFDVGTSDGSRGLTTGGLASGNSNVIQYVTIATPGNATDFGDMGFADYQMSATNDATYSVAGGGAQFYNILEYVTIQTTGNSTDFGDFSTTGRRNCATLSDSTRGVFVGGNLSGATSNVIDYITVATPGNATDFGDLTTAGHKAGGQSNGTTGIFAGTSYVNEIEQITIQTTGNATDFGDLTTTRADGTAGASGSPS